MYSKKKKRKTTKGQLEALKKGREVRQENIKRKRKENEDKK